MEPPEIERLDERTIQRIAAGEVVERPASVVKELIENSLDAGANRIAVAVESGGVERIRVRDDGVGIPADQLEAAVDEHATSKISTISDLDRGVGTLGFRGEALYTIGAVSQLTLRSRPPDAESGAEITVEGGNVGEIQPAGSPRGTVVEVDDLFYNTPARKKFLKRTATEFDHVNTVVTSYALANPDVAMSLEHDGRETFATEGNGDLRSAVLAVYGREVAESMVDVEWVPTGETSEPGDGDDADSAVPVRRVSGLVSHPETTRTSREYLATYVNDRYVTASVLREAVIDAYGGQLAPDRYPFAVLFVETPPSDVDVNVHPRKLEVRFDEEHAVRSAVEEAVETSLLDHGLIRSTAPRGRSAPEETTVVPDSPDSEALGGSGTGHEAAAAARRSTDRSEGDEEVDRPSATSDPTAASELSPADEEAWTIDDLDDGTPSKSTIDETTRTDASETRDVSKAHDATSELPDHVTEKASEGRPSPREWQSDAESDDASSGSGSRSTESESGDNSSDSRGESFAASGTQNDDQRTLGGGTTSDERAFDSLPKLRVLGQFHDTYVVAESSDGLLLVDQHAADERVNYERLRREFSGGVDAQALATPVSVELTAREAALFVEFVDELSEIGFRADRVGDREVVVEAVPAVFDAALDAELLRDVLSSFVGDATEATDPVDDVVDELLADLACYPSVTGNTSLTEGSVVELLDRLDDCENPYACPHGRPVVIRFDQSEIEDRFERDYPGHVGRRAE
ncbi:DNA mismatch repair endonuclease MutL [Halorubrum luteum]